MGSHLSKCSSRLLLLEWFSACFSSVLGFGRDVLTRTTTSGAHLDEIALTKRLLIDILSQVVIIEKDGLAGAPRRLVAIAYGPPALGLTAPTETIIEPDNDGRGLQIMWVNVNQSKPVTRRILSAETESSFSYFQADHGWAPEMGHAGYPTRLSSDPATPWL